MQAGYEDEIGPSVHISGSMGIPVSDMISSHSSTSGSAWRAMPPITQVKSRPPSFVVFGTRVDQLPESYRRYLLNSMRRDLGLGAVPLRLTMRATKNPYHDKQDGKRQ